MVAMVAIDLLDMAVLRLTLAPSQHYSPVGQEHGRTIPLAAFASPINAAGQFHCIVLIDKTIGRASLRAGSIHPPPAPVGDGERINLFRALAIGERVGNAGPDLIRSPMKRCCHARFPRCKSYGALSAGCLEGEGCRNHTCRSSGVDLARKLPTEELAHFVERGRKVLVAMQHKAQRELKKYEDALNIATTVLGERRQ